MALAVATADDVSGASEFAVASDLIVGPVTASCEHHEDIWRPFRESI